MICKVIGISIILIFLILTFGCIDSVETVCGYEPIKDFGQVESIEINSNFWGASCLVEFENGFEKVFTGSICSKLDNTKHICVEENPCARNEKYSLCEGFNSLGGIKG